MLNRIIQVQATRRAQSQQAVRNNQQATAPTGAIRSRRFRRILAAVLVTIGAIAFVEVVLFPGSMIRRNVAAAPTAATSDEEDDRDLHLPPFLMTDEMRSRQRQAQLDRIDKKLRDTHQKLGGAIAELQSAIASLNRYGQDRLQIQPASPHAMRIPPALTDVVLHQPTGRTAWSRLTQVEADADTKLHDAQFLLESVSGRCSNGAFLPEDNRDMREANQKVQTTRIAVVQATAYIDHLFMLRRARAALVRQASLEPNTGGPP